MLVYIKSKEEIKGFEEAGRITGKILDTLLNKTKIGISTKELDDIAREECEKYKVKPAFLNYQGFPAAICASTNNILVHGIPNNIPLKHDDIISIDMGVSMDGFIGDTAVTIDLSGTNKKLLSCCEKALYLGISQAKPGNKLSQISKTIYKHIKKNNFSTPIEYGGHGIDRDVLHSDPFVPNVPDYEEDLTLRAGIIFAIEPMVIDGKSHLQIADSGWDIIADGMTAHFEHTVLITDTGCKILTRREE